MVNKYSRHLLGDIQKDKDKLIHAKHLKFIRNILNMPIFKLHLFIRKTQRDIV